MNEDNTAKAGKKFVPNSWSSPFDLFKYSKAIVQLNLSTVIILLVGYILIELILRIALKNIGILISYLIDPIVVGGLTYAYLQGSKGKRVELDEALNVGVKNWLNFLILGILLAVICIVSLVLLIVPFLFVLPRVVLSPYYLLDKGLSPIDAIKASWEGTKGHAWDVWGIFLVTILFGLLMLVIVGIYFYVLYSAALCVLYRILTKKSAA